MPEPTEIRITRADCLAFHRYQMALTEDNLAECRAKSTSFGPELVADLERDRAILAATIRFLEGPQ